MFNVAREEPLATEKALEKAPARPELQVYPKARPGLSHVALVGSFPPRRCGIATFTADVCAQLTRTGARCDIVAIAEPDDEMNPAVRHVVRQDEIADYVRAANRLEAEGVELVCVQHEFGIFGGEAGDHLLAMLDALTMPVVTTLHTVLERPNEDQSRVMAALLRRSARVIVMAERGRRILLDRYNAPEQKIVVIPHGAPDYPLVEPDTMKPKFGLEGRDVLLTFGLLSPGKGIESVIRALPQVIADHPRALYVVLGATHPHLRRREGEGYRESLIALADQLGVGDHVRFVNAYVSTEELLDYLAAADIYVTPYLNEAQITSGTLSYAVALGKPVVSTSFWHAQELLADDVGKLVGFNDSDGFATALNEILADKGTREAYRQRAYAKGRETIWPRTGARFAQTFAAAAGLASKPHERRRILIDPPNLRAVERMTDACGIFQHGIFSVPDRDHGYCLDDNARALILMLRGRASGLRGAQAEGLIATYASFVQYAWNKDRGAFRNFMSYDRRWLEEAGSADSFGRALWSIGETARLSRDDDMVAWALAFSERIVPHVADIAPLRSLAFSCLGLCGLASARTNAFRGDSAERRALEAAAHTLFDALKRESKPGWTWFEPTLAYDNARLPEALIVAGRCLQAPAMRDAGLEALAWLTTLQSSPGGHFRAIGNATFGKPYPVPSAFDQQPLEAAATIDACWAAYDASGDPVWEEEAQRAYAWFFGRNDCRASLVAPNGGCYDGLQPGGVNRNQGAESILSLQLSNCAMKARERGRRLRVGR